MLILNNGRSPPEIVRRVLLKVARLVQPILEAYDIEVKSLAESAPEEEADKLGYWLNDHICLNFQHSFRVIVDTMLHEMVHHFHQGHGSQFWR
jgi:predicted metal-dependent hydrolase